MPLYTVRLESQTDDHWRLRTLEATDEKAAAQVAEQLEDTRAAYSLTERPLVKQIQTRRDQDKVHATVNLDAFAGTGLAGRDLLEFVERDHAVDADGKTHGPSRHFKHHLQAHYQTEPFQIRTVDPVVPTAGELVRMAQAMVSHPGRWDEALKAMREADIPLGAVTGALYGVPWQKQIDGSSVSVWSSAAIQTSLHTAYTLDQDTHDFFNDVSGTEITGTGYTTKGVTLGSKASTYDTATDQIRLDAADASWTTSTLSATDAIVWVDTAGASTTDPVLGAIDFGSTVSTTAGTFLITWDATGIIVYDVT